MDLVALDVSHAMLALIDCPSYVARHSADATLGLPFADASFDGVVAAGLLEHLRDPEPLFRDAARVLKPGGPFLFTFPPGGSGSREPGELDEGLLSHDAVATRARLARSGLSVVHEMAFPAYLNGSHGWITHHLVLVRKTSATAGAGAG
jgi:SAM-dependent methyltransferase